MANGKRIALWMICSFLTSFAMLSIVQNVDTAPVIKALRRSSKSNHDEDDSHEQRQFAPKYMMDLYNIIVDKHGNRRKGVITTANKIKCFFSVSSSNYSSEMLTFDIRDVGRDEAVIKAQLNLFKLRPRSGQNSPGFFQVDVIDNTNGQIITARMLNCRGGGWKSFDLTNAVKRWHIQQRNDYTIRVRVRGHGNNIGFARGNNIERLPFLVVYLKAKSTIGVDTVNSESITSRLPKPERGPRNKRGSNGHPCKRKSMLVDTAQIGWDGYVLAPRIFDVYRCEGKCRAYSSQAVKKQTTHALLQAMLAQLGTKANGRPIRPPCCAPSQFESKMLLIHRKVDGHEMIGLEEFNDMVVKSCACL